MLLNTYIVILFFMISDGTNTAPQYWSSNKTFNSFEQCEAYREGAKFTNDVYSGLAKLRGVKDHTGNFTYAVWGERTYCKATGENIGRTQ